MTNEDQRFSKLEAAALQIAAGMVDGNTDPEWFRILARRARTLAEAVLRECIPTAEIDHLNAEREKRAAMYAAELARAEMESTT